VPGAGCPIHAASSHEWVIAPERDPLFAVVVACGPPKPTNPITYTHKTSKTTANSHVKPQTRQNPHHKTRNQPEINRLQTKK
jgi:hypothetical protein